MNNLTKLHLYRHDDLYAFGLGELLFAEHVDTLLDVSIEKDDNNEIRVSINSFAYRHSDKKRITFVYE